jgi:hypothetical protein
VRTELRVLIMFWAGLCVQPSGAEELLVIKPVVNEILGHFVKTQNLTTFVDCLGKHHDPSAGKIKPTQNTCGSAPSLISFKPIGELLTEPVYDAYGTQLGTIDTLGIADDKTKIDVFLDTKPAAPIYLDEGNLDAWLKKGDGKFVLMGSDLTWSANISR